MKICVFGAGAIGGHLAARFATHALVLCREPGAALSDAVNVAVTLAIEARTRSVNTVVECNERNNEHSLPLLLGRGGTLIASARAAR